MEKHIHRKYNHAICYNILLQQVPRLEMVVSAIYRFAIDFSFTNIDAGTQLLSMVIELQ